MTIFLDEATGAPVKIRIRKPADMHQHLRQDEMLQLVIPKVAERFAMAIVMPNTIPPITREQDVSAYRQEITSAAPGFAPLMTMYLTDTLYPGEVARCLADRTIVGIKYYPRGLTTNSNSGVSDPAALWTKDTRPYECLKLLDEYGGVLLLHAADGFASEAWDNEGRFYDQGDELDPFDQEPHFICNTLQRIRDARPELKISVEHLSTALGAEYLRVEGGEKLGCSLTAHHLLLDRRDVFRQGFRPHTFCWPIIQPNEHKQELRKLAAEGHDFVWLGSDSAPHPVGKKLADCCSGGVFTAHAGIELYVEAFEDMNCLDKLEAFASINGPKFYGIEPSTKTVELVREEWKVYEAFYALGISNEDGGPDKLIPFRLGETVRWKLVS